MSMNQALCHLQKVSSPAKLQATLLCVGGGGVPWPILDTFSLREPVRSAEMRTWVPGRAGEKAGSTSALGPQVCDIWSPLARWPDQPAGPELCCQGERDAAEQNGSAPNAFTKSILGAAAGTGRGPGVRGHPPGEPACSRGFWACSWLGRHWSQPGLTESVAPGAFAPSLGSEEECGCGHPCSFAV